MLADYLVEQFGDKNGGVRPSFLSGRSNRRLSPKSNLLKGSQGASGWLRAHEDGALQCHHGNLKLWLVL
jgi:hypothetical protein